MENVQNLYGTRFGIDRDYPKEIAVARKKLYDFQRMNFSKKDKCKIQYPAKLIVNGKLVRDEFPDWHHLLNMNLLEMFDETAEDSVYIRSTVIDSQSHTLATQPVNLDIPSTNNSLNSEIDISPPIVQYPLQSHGGPVQTTINESAGNHTRNLHVNKSTLSCLQTPRTYSQVTKTNIQSNEHSNRVLTSIDDTSPTNSNTRQFSGMSGDNRNSDHQQSMKSDRSTNSNYQ
jgi:hypothetical protein